MNDCIYLSITEFRVSLDRSLFDPYRRRVIVQRDRDRAIKILHTRILRFPWRIVEGEMHEPDVHLFVHSFESLSLIVASSRVSSFAVTYSASG